MHAQAPRVFCYCFDHNNTLPAIVSAQSLIDTLASASPVVIYMITTDPHFDADKIDLRGKDVRIEVCVIENPFANYPSRDYISPATFMRFLVARHVDPAYGRVLYMDADTMLRADVCEVFDTDLAGAPVAAVPDYPLLVGGRYWTDFRFSYDGKPYRPVDYMTDILGVDPAKSDYLSCGVLLIDLAKWNEVCDAAVSFMNRSATLDFLDQDAISAVLKGNFARLAPEYNAQSEIAFPDGRTRWQKLTGWGNDLHHVVEIWRTRAKIVHFAGANKPWLDGTQPTALERYWWSAARNSRVFDDVAHLAHREHVKIAPRRC